MNKKITIIFVSYHSNKKILKFLKQLKNKFKFIIIENSKDYSLLKIIKRYKNVTAIISNKNKGFGAGSNIGLKKIKTKYALQLDLDTTISNSSINKLIEKADSLNNFTILGPRISNFKYKSEHFIKRKIAKNIHKMNFIDGSCLLFDMKKIKKIGYFDENFFLYFEETDLIRRCINNKQNVFMVDNIRMSHKGGSSVDSKLNKEIEINRNWHYMWSKFYFYRKHHNYLIALYEIKFHLISAILKIIFYTIAPNRHKQRIYFARFSGLINSMIFKKSWHRPKV